MTKWRNNKKYAENISALAGCWRFGTPYPHILTLAWTPLLLDLKDSDGSLTATLISSLQVKCLIRFIFSERAFDLPSHGVTVFFLWSYRLIRCQRNKFVTLQATPWPFTLPFPDQSPLISRFPPQTVLPIPIKAQLLACSWAQRRAADRSGRNGGGGADTGAKCINSRGLLQVDYYMFFGAWNFHSIVFEAFFTHLGSESFPKCKIPLGPYSAQSRC